MSGFGIPDSKCCSTSGSSSNAHLSATQELRGELSDVFGGILSEYHPRRWSGSKDDGNEKYLFSVASNNVQGHRSGLDSSNVRKSIDYLTRIASSEAAHHEITSILALQEVQQCRDKLKLDRKGCKYCATNTCEYDHAEIIHNILCNRNYQGGYNNKMKNTVGLYFDTDLFDLVDGTFRYANFDHGKGAILAVLQYKDKAVSSSSSSSSTRPAKEEIPLSSSLIGRKKRILVVSLHLSVPKNQSGDPDTSRSVDEVRQLFSKINSVWRANNGPLPTLLLGDFNSLSYDSDNARIAKADVYRSITDPESELNALLDEMAAKWRKHEYNDGGGKEGAGGGGGSGGSSRGGCHNIKEDLREQEEQGEGGDQGRWKSAYFEVNGEEPKYTSTKRGPPGSDHSKDFIHCIDYIFYRSTSIKLRPTSVLSVKPIDRDNLPYPATPSDHLPIAALFSLDKS